MDKMREEFEAWVVSEFGFDVSKIHGGGAYCSGDTFTAWSAWKASRSALCVELPKTPKYESSEWACGYGCAVSDFKDGLTQTGVTCK